MLIQDWYNWDYEKWGVLNCFCWADFQDDEKMGFLKNLFRRANDEDYKNVVLSLSKIYDEDMKNLSEFNLSKEQSFWASFAIMSLRQWGALHENGIEFKFSNLLRLYADFRINSLNVKMKDEDKKDFLTLLKKKYNLIREKVYHEEFEVAGLPQVIFGEQPDEVNLWPLIVAVPDIIKLAGNHCLLPYNLVKDI